jgi:hypothetical protein
MQSSHESHKFHRTNADPSAISDIEAQRQRDIKEARGQASQGRRGPKRSQSSPAQVTGKRTRSQEIEEAENEIKEAGLKKYCSVLGF